MAQEAIEFGGPISCFSWSWDGTKLATCGFDSSTIDIWAVPTSPDLEWTKLAVLKGHESMVTCLDWGHPDGLLVSGSVDRNAFVWRFRRCGKSF